METVLENTLPVGKPKWLKVKLPIGQKYTELRGLVDKYSLNTICTSGSCRIWVNVGAKARPLS
jgi:lipoic acid synthetase